MSAKREIRAKRIIQDIASGIGDLELMHTYKLTFKGLQSVYRKLLDLKLIDPVLVKERIVQSVSTEKTITKRLPRKEIFVPLPVEEAHNPGVRGVITDINERGLAERGLGVAVDEVKRLIIRPEEFFVMNPIHFKAQCRWMKHSDDAAEVLAGFEIIAIARSELSKLKEFIETLEYMYG